MQQLRVRTPECQGDALLHRKWISHARRPNHEVSGVHLDLFAGEQRTDRLGYRDATSDPAGHAGPHPTNGTPLRRSVASAEPQARPAVGDHVQRRDVGGQQHGLTNAGVRDVGAQPEG